jgi:hypothetical protein
MLDHFKLNVRITLILNYNDKIITNKSNNVAVINKELILMRNR